MTDANMYVDITRKYDLEVRTSEFIHMFLATIGCTRIYKNLSNNFYMQTAVTLTEIRSISKTVHLKLLIV